MEMTLKKVVVAKF